ncbi:hypothetical protein ACFSTH_09465 [Paenibacillus yanchengensis]
MKTGVKAPFPQLGHLIVNIKESDLVGLYEIELEKINEHHTSLEEDRS